MFCKKFSRMRKNYTLQRLLVPDLNTKSIVSVLDVLYSTHHIYNAVYLVNTNDRLIIVKLNDINYRMVDIRCEIISATSRWITLINLILQIEM